MITVARFDLPEYAHLARAILSVHEIEAWIFDENIVQLNWMLCIALGGAKLVVRSEDRDRAAHILKSASSVPMEGPYETISVPAGHIFVWLLSMACGAPCFFFGRKTYYIDPETGKILSRKSRTENRGRDNLA